MQIESSFDVRFHDLDALGHAHHTTVMHAFDGNRLALLEQLDPELGLRPLPLVEVYATYRSPIGLHPLLVKGTYSIDGREVNAVYSVYRPGRDDMLAGGTSKLIADEREAEILKAYLPNTATI